ncbi:MAG: DUF4431 domain-containing protein [Deltaproteobacteria bacterium]|nr:DUF4431 domain-containing protein [Deltaproteobacteria bacterium]
MKKKFITRILLTFVFVLGLIAFAGDAQAEECLSYEPAEVSLTGTLTRKILPGPPEFESIEKGDRPEMYWMLKLSKPACVNPDPDDEIYQEDNRDIRRMHLVINTEDYPRYERLLSKKVVVIGILFHKYTRYDHTMVLEVSSIKPAKDKSRK